MTTYHAQTCAGIKKWHIGTATSGPKCLCGVELMYPGDTRPFVLKYDAEARVYETSDDLAKADCGACLRNREYRAATGAGPARPVVQSRVVAGGRRSADERATERLLTAAADRRADRAAATHIQAGARVTAAGIDAEGNGNTTPRQERDELDARVTALLATYAAGQVRTPAELREAMDPRPELPAVTASVKRLAKLGNEAAAASAATTKRRTSRADKAHARQEADRARREAVAGADATVASIDAALAAGPDAPAPVADGTPGPDLNPPARRERPLSKAAKARALVEAGECATLKDARAYLADMGE